MTQNTCPQHFVFEAAAACLAPRQGLFARCERSLLYAMRPIAYALIGTGAWTVAAALLGYSGPASAHSYKLGDIAIGHFWAPPPQEDATGVPVYGPVLNRGKVAVRLLGATSSVSALARLRIASDGEVRWPRSMTFAPGKPLALAPWREHIWLSGLKRSLKAGDAFDLTLDFGSAGQLKIKVVVEQAVGH